MINDWIPDILILKAAPKLYNTSALWEEEKLLFVSRLRNKCRSIPSVAEDVQCGLVPFKKLFFYEHFYSIGNIKEDYLYGSGINKRVRKMRKDILLS